MQNRQPAIGPLSKQVTIVLGLTIVGFMAFGLALSIYRTILFEQTLSNLAVQNDELGKRIQVGYGDLAYARSDQYKDKYAKENFNRVQPGEKMIILTPPPPSSDDSTIDHLLDEARREAAYLEILRQMPTLEHWKLYLLHREKLKELKDGL